MKRYNNKPKQTVAPLQVGAGDTAQQQDFISSYNSAMGLQRPTPVANVSAGSMAPAGAAVGAQVATDLRSSLKAASSPGFAPLQVGAGDTAQQQDFISSYNSAMGDPYAPAQQPVGLQRPNPMNTSYDVDLERRRRIAKMQANAMAQAGNRDVVQRNQLLAQGIANI